MMYPKKHQANPIYGPIDKDLGMDWLSMLSRMRQADTGAGLTNTPVYQPQPWQDVPMPNAYSVAPDSPEELRKRMFQFGGMFGGGI